MIHLTIKGTVKEHPVETHTTLTNALAEVGLDNEHILLSWSDDTSETTSVTIPGHCPQETRLAIQRILKKAWNTYGYKVSVRRANPVTRERYDPKNIRDYLSKH